MLISTRSRGGIWLFPAIVVTCLMTSCYCRTNNFNFLDVFVPNDEATKEDTDYTVVTNNFVDDYIQQLRHYVEEKGDMVELQDFAYEDRFKWLFQQGGYRLDQCRLKYLSRIARSSNSHLTVGGTVLAKVGMRGLQLQCQALVWFGPLRQRVRVFLTAEDIRAEVTSKIPEWKANVPEISELTVTHMGHMDVDIHGVGFLRKIINAIVRSKINQKREKIVNKINQIAVQNINFLLTHLPVPLRK